MSLGIPGGPNSNQPPEWVQNQIQSSVRGPMTAGSYDPALQMRDTQAAWQPQMQQLQQQYGEAYQNPYFMQNQSRYADQMDNLNIFSRYGLGMDPTLQSYQIQGQGDIYGMRRNAFSGDIQSPLNKVASYQDMANQWHSGANQAIQDSGLPRSNPNRASTAHILNQLNTLELPEGSFDFGTYAPHLDMTSQEYFNTYSSRNRGPIYSQIPARRGGGIYG